MEQLKVTITLTQAEKEYLDSLMDRDGELKKEGVDFSAEDYAAKIEEILDRMTW